MAQGETTQPGAVWRDRKDVAPPNPKGADLARLIRRGFGLRTFDPPALPGVAARVLELAQNPEADLRALAEVIEKDMLISANILRLMESPLYNRGIHITSIEQAVNRLGLKAVRNVVAEAALNTTVFHSEAYEHSMERLRLHSAATAQIAQLVSKQSGANHDLAFLSGLFHDIGLAAPLLLVGEVYPDSPPKLDDLWPELLWLHEQISWHVMRFWKLPESIREIIRFHHAIPEEARDPMGSAIVCLADRIVSDCGLSHTHPELDHTTPEESSRGITPDIEFGRAKKYLGITSSKYDILMKESEKVIEQLT